MTEIISASHDVVFKALFVRNPDVLRAFLRDVLDLPLSDDDEVTILNPELIPETADGKLSRLDIHVKMAHRKFNIEMQARKRALMRSAFCIIGVKCTVRILNPAASMRI